MHRKPNPMPQRGATRRATAPTAKAPTPKSQPVAKPVQGAARQQQPSLRIRSQGYLRHHRAVARSSLLRLMHNPLATLMTLAAIAIALTLPAVLQAGLQNAHSLTGGWQGAVQLSLFLKPEVSDAQARDLATQLGDNDQIASVDYLSSAQALEEFQMLSGFGDALRLLDSNPLPAVLLIEPAEGYRDPERLAQLRELLSAVDGVDSADLDLAWMQRLQAILNLLQRALVAIGLLLGATVLLVIGNTIRLAIESQRDEIVVAKLVGATDAFVRRPFLYTGAWYGLGGGLIALVLVALSLAYLEAPWGQLMQLYGSNLPVRGLGWGNALLLLIGALLLGVLGGWIAVGRHLRAIEPR